MPAAATAQKGQEKEPNSMTAMSDFHNAFISIVAPVFKSSSGKLGARMVAFGALADSS